MHEALGPGLLESAYCHCLCHELHVAGLRFERERSIPIRYRDVTLECGYRADLIVENALLVELKVVEALLPLHEAQLLTYLRLSGLRAGILINFNVRHLKDGIRRVVN